MLRPSVLLALLCATLSSGCAFGHKVAYTGPFPQLDVTGAETIGLAVYDQRKHVITREASPDFVGEFRSLYHIPYGVYTASGKPLAEDLTVVVASAFSAKGFTPVSVATTPFQSQEDIIGALARQKTPRSVLLTLFDWRTDTYFKTQLFYDIGVTILDQAGGVIVQDRLTGQESELTTHPAGAFRTRAEVLLNRPAIREALTGPEAPPSSTVTTTPPSPTPSSEPASSWRVFSYAPGMTDRTGLAELAPSIESCRLIRNALEPHHPGRILTCEIVPP